MSLACFITVLVVTITLTLALFVPGSTGYTYEQDVYAINNLYGSLGAPPLPGWVLSGGDPCTEAWQGVQCVNANITGIVLNGVTLGGELGDEMGNFSSIITIDLSYNHIGGNIPNNLPPTIRKFFLSANQLTGIIPSSLSTLALLSELSLNNNLLGGELPDAFQTLTDLMNLDISFNNLSGKLPPSLGNLTSLATMHIQNNQITGRLDILQDLPLQDLNIENNLFWGPIPLKLLGIPDFKKDGNPFNTTVLPPPPSVPPSPSPSPLLSPLSPSISNGPTSGAMSGNSTMGPPPVQDGLPPKGLKKPEVKTIAWITLAIVVPSLIILLLCWSCCKYNNKSSQADKSTKRQEYFMHMSHNERPKGTESLIQQQNQIEKVVVKKMDVQNPTKEQTKMGTTPLPQLVEPVITNPLTHASLSKGLDPSTSLMTFSIASLQQCTNYFGQDYLLRNGTLGNFYYAVLPDGQHLMVRTLDKALNALLKDEDFFNLVLNMAKLRHGNVSELVGYSMECAERILVYNYCGSQTLEDALHSGDELRNRLSWNDRIQIALGAARALEYLHEVCQPPVVNQNFKSSTLFLDDKLNVRASDCGLAPLISSVPASERTGYMELSGYYAPEFLSMRKYTIQSDIFSFGVIMLELLTGRKPYDNSQHRGEHYLARWAVNQLHDIESLTRMVDPILDGTSPEKSLSRFADIISLCLEPEPEFRPPMSEIVQMLWHMIQREALQTHMEL